MKKKARNTQYTLKQRLIAASILASLVGTQTVSPGTLFGAGFVDDWITQKSSNSTSSFTGAQRGYMNAGSFSGRIPTSNDHLVSLSAPSLKFGCGSIDAFMGGMSFLNADYLVAKLQRILAAAPAAAFDLALKTLAPQVAETIKTLESIADRLNGLQLDDCKASKALVATIASASPVQNEAMKGQIAADQASFMQSTGVDDLWQNIKKDSTALQKTWAGSAPPAGSNKIKDSAKGALSGCPAEIMSVFGQDGSLLTALANQKGVPPEYIPLLRGYIGDVVLITPDTSGSSYDAVYVPPCGKNDGLNPFIDGQGEQRDSPEGACSAIADTNANLTSYVGGMMYAVLGKMSSRQALSSEESSFLQSMPLPVSVILKNSVAARADTPVIGRLSDITAKAYAYYMLTDLLGKTLQLHAQAKHLLSAQKNSGAGSESDTCNLGLLQPAVSQMELLEANTVKVIATARETYASSLQETQALEAFVQSMARFRDQIQTDISQQFGAAVARRAAGG